MVQTLQIELGKAAGRRGGGAAEEGGKGAVRYSRYSWVKGAEAYKYLIDRFRAALTANLNSYHLAKFYSLLLQKK